MTNDTTSRPVPSTAPSGTTAAPPDPRPLFARASALACEVIAGVGPDQLSAPTPCTKYDVRGLLGHTVAVLRRVAAVGRGEDVFTTPQVVQEPESWSAAARAAAEDVAQVWADPSVLTRQLVLPFGTVPGAAALATYTGELTTHTWDIAVSTGQTPQWDPEVVAAALAAARRILPADNRGDDIPFAEVVAVPDSAPLIDQLAGWQGRDPAWRPAG